MRENTISGSSVQAKTASTGVGESSPKQNSPTVPVKATARRVTDADALIAILQDAKTDLMERGGIKSVSWESEHEGEKILAIVIYGGRKCGKCSEWYVNEHDCKSDKSDKSGETVK